MRTSNLSLVICCALDTYTRLMDEFVVAPKVYPSEGNDEDFNCR